MTEQWIVVPNWERFQHYRDRDPPWIKLHRSLASDPDWLNATGHRRGLLISVWLEYASTHGRVRFDARSLSHRINLRVSSSDLEWLVHAGFLEVSASKPLAKPEQNATPEGEGEREPPNPRQRQDRKPAATNGTTPAFPCPHCGVLLRGPIAVADHVENVHYDLNVKGGDAP